MGEFHEFAMERLMSTWENTVDFNLSESGVHPLTLGELVELAGIPVDELFAIGLGYPQANGLVELRETIAATYAGAGADNVLVTVGAAEANYLALTTFVERGDEVVIVLPNYMQVHGIAQNVEARVRPVPLVEERGWKLDLEALERAVTPATRLVCVCNPNNPTGRILDEEERQAVVAAAERAGAWLLADEVYRGAEHEGVETPSFFGSYERVLAQGSMSKAYGLPGLRVGWAVGPPDACERMWRRHEYTTIATTMISNVLARLALSPDVRPRLLARTRDYNTAGWSYLAAWAEEHDQDVRLFPPQAAAIAFGRYSARIPSLELVDRLRKEKSVLVVPGDHFGLDGCLRISFGLPAEQLNEGLGRLGELLVELRA